ncbi:hypothetical protein [Mycobacterium sp. TY813]|uniref:hypothetical protein n=1 Tax=Mycobacterium TaxID=1763 RepID=UPI002741951C|nr:hypothetical protein [Mycobacterium sp. TY813]MDP7729516.1 hypothetical protein [Mycobacterium sp. TY813]
MQLTTSTGEPPDESLSDGTVVSWEFYDGETAVIDTGFDRITRARLGDIPTGRLNPPRTALDVLHVGPPTPSPRWQQLTDVGCYHHPHDIRPLAVNCRYRREAI